MDKTKLLNMLATKRSTFDSLYKKMEKIPDTLECGESIYEILCIHGFKQVY